VGQLPAHGAAQEATAAGYENRIHVTGSERAAGARRFSRACASQPTPQVPRG
jgi:hypothetical protein